MKEDGGGGGGGGGGGDGFLPLAIVTVTDWLVAWLFPASRWAFTVSLCCPSGSDVVSKRPAGSPPNWYGAVGSVHLDDPSIRNSILFGVPPDDAVHVTWPDRVMLSSSFEPLIEDETVSPDSVLEAELAPVSETASTETAINSSAKRECGFTRVTPSCSVRLPGRTCYRSVSPLLKHRSLNRGRAPARAREDDQGVDRRRAPARSGPTTAEFIATEGVRSWRPPLELGESALPHVRWPVGARTR